MTVAATIRTWAEMIKFSHSVFALPFAMIATFLAGRQLDGGLPAWPQLGLIVVCMVAARSFAMTFNRITDATIDARNPRTAGRPLPTGKIAAPAAWLFLAIGAVVFIAACAAFLLVYGNAWPLRLALPTLLFLAVYSYAKRVTALAHFLLGAAIAFSPVAAWIAIHPASLGLPAMILAAAVLFWIAGFDIIYACQDVQVDRRDGLFSLPTRYGIARALLLSRGCHLLTIAMLVALGLVAELGWIYWAAVVVTSALLAAEQAVVRPNDLSRVNLAFFTMNGCVSLLLGAATIADLLLLGSGR
ncbi:MAG: UbiA family prenyltransferase [Phycisphaerae bacterium]|nr:UbiA family prenyltransferase [Phycisphaerae bacterium]